MAVTDFDRAHAVNRLPDNCCSRFNDKTTILNKFEIYDYNQDKTEKSYVG